MSLDSKTQDYCMERLTIRKNFPIESQWNNMTITIFNFQFGQKIKTSKKHEYRWTNASGRCLDPKFYNKVLRLSPFKLNLIVKQSRHAYARKHIHRYLVSIKLIQFRIFQQLIDSLVLYAICSSFIIILFLKLR